MIYSLAAVKTVIGIVAFAIFFGFFEGGGQYDARAHPQHALIMKLQ